MSGTGPNQPQPSNLSSQAPTTSSPSVPRRPTDKNNLPTQQSNRLYSFSPTPGFQNLQLQRSTFNEPSGVSFPGSYAFQDGRAGNHQGGNLMSQPSPMLAHLQKAVAAKRKPAVRPGKSPSKTRPPISHQYQGDSQPSYQTSNSMMNSSALQISPQNMPANFVNQQFQPPQGHRGFFIPPNIMSQGYQNKPTRPQAPVPSQSRSSGGNMESGNFPSGIMTSKAQVQFDSRLPQGIIISGEHSMTLNPTVYRNLLAAHSQGQTIPSNFSTPPKGMTVQAAGTLPAETKRPAHSSPVFKRNLPQKRSHSKMGIPPPSAAPPVHMDSIRSPRETAVSRICLDDREFEIHTNEGEVSTYELARRWFQNNNQFAHQFQELKLLPMEFECFQRDRVMTTVNAAKTAQLPDVGDSELQSYLESYIRKFRGTRKKKHEIQKETLLKSQKKLRDRFLALAGGEVVSERA